MCENIEITRNFIDLSQSKNIYALSIRLSSGGFCFSILNLHNKKFIYYKEEKFKNKIAYLQELEEFFLKESLFKLPYYQIDVVVSDPNFILIPEDLNEEGLEKDLYSLSFLKNNKKTKLIKNSLAFKKMYGVFEIEDEVSFLIKKYFENYRLLHYSEVLLQTALLSARNLEKTMYVDLADSILRVIVVEKDKLLFFNTFSYKENIEWVYFVVNVFTSLSLNQEKTKVYLTGEIERNSEEMIILKEYILNVILDDSIVGYKLIEDFSNINLHKITKKIVSCVL